MSLILDFLTGGGGGGGSLARIKKGIKLRFYNACDGFVKGFPFFCHNLIRPLITEKEKNAFNMNIEVYLGHHNNFKVVNKLKLIAKVFTFVIIVSFSNVFVSIRWNLPFFESVSTLWKMRRNLVFGWFCVFFSFSYLSFFSFQRKMKNVHRNGSSDITYWSPFTRDGNEVKKFQHRRRLRPVKSQVLT